MIKVFKEKAGVISPKECWVCISGGYLYTGDTFWGVIWLMLTEWKNDRHLVG